MRGGSGRYNCNRPGVSNIARKYIPQSFEELSPAWLTGTLRAAGLLERASVTAVDVEIIGAGEGFVGEIGRLRLTFDAPEACAPGSLIVKLPTGNRTNRGMAQMGAAYEREIRFYQELAEEVPIRTPRLYHADCDATPGAAYGERIARVLDGLPYWLLGPVIDFFVWLGRLPWQRSILLLEDMAPARVGDQVNGCSLDQTRTILRSIAAAHAPYWDSPRLRELWWLGALDVLARSFKLLLRRSRSSYDERYRSLFGGLYEWLDQHSVELTKQLVMSPATLIHGDFRLDNLFLTESDPAEVAAIDWQVASRGPGVWDVAYFLCGTLARDVSSQTELELLRVYHDELLAHGVCGYDFDRCLLDYRRCLLILVGRLVAGAESLEFEHERGHVLIDTWLARLAARVRDLDPDALLDSVRIA